MAGESLITIGQVTADSLTSMSRETTVPGVLTDDESQFGVWSIAQPTDGCIACARLQRTQQTTRCTIRQTEVARPRGRPKVLRCEACASERGIARKLARRSANMRRKEELERAVASSLVKGENQVTALEHYRARTHSASDPCRKAHCPECGKLFTAYHHRHLRCAGCQITYEATQRR